MEDHSYHLAQEKTRERESSPSKKRKREEAIRNRNRRRQKTRINIGVAFPQWKSLMRDKCFQSDAEVACFLLDRAGSYSNQLAPRFVIYNDDDDDDDDDAAMPVSRPSSCHGQVEVVVPADEADVHCERPTCQLMLNRLSDECRALRAELLLLREVDLLTSRSQEDLETDEKEVPSCARMTKQAVTVKQECGRKEVSDDSHYGVEMDEQQEQAMAAEIKEEPLDEEASCPHRPLEQEASTTTYPLLPTTPLPSVLYIEASSYSLPPRLRLQLLLIHGSPGLSVLWDVEEGEGEAPSPPPMESYSVYMAVEKHKGSGVLGEWTTLGVVKAIPLPMCVMISHEVKPGYKACFAVVGKDMFGRYGPYSEIMPGIILSDQATLKTQVSRLF